MGFLKKVLKTVVKVAAVAAVAVIAVKTGGAALPFLKGLAAKVAPTLMAKLPALQSVASSFVGKFMTSPLALQARNVVGSFSGLVGQARNSSTLANIMEAVIPRIRSIPGGERFIQQFMNVVAQTQARSTSTALVRL